MKLLIIFILGFVVCNTTLYAQEIKCDSIFIYCVPANRYTKIPRTVKHVKNESETNGYIKIIYNSDLLSKLNRIAKRKGASIDSMCCETTMTILIEAFKNGTKIHTYFLSSDIKANHDGDCYLINKRYRRIILKNIPKKNRKPFILM